MARLSDDFHSALTPEILEILDQKSINTCLGFVRTNPELLAKITGLKYSEILEIKDEILSKFSSQLRSGDKWYEDILNHCAIIPSGIDNLDKLLDSGFVTGNIYEFCGFAGCGKTQICMSVAANVVSQTQQKVLYIDTKNDISAHRLADMIQTPNVGEMLEKIQIIQTRSACDLLQCLHQIQSKLNATKEKYLGFKLLIIDSLSALFQQSQNQTESLSLLNNVANILKYIAVEFHIAVVLTNYVSSWVSDEGVEDEEYKQMQQPALGKYWAHETNTRIMVKKLDGANECLLVVLKSQSEPVGKSVTIKIGDEGVS